MEFLIYAILIYLAYVIIKWLIINIIIPFGKIALVIFSIAGAVIGTFFALKSYIVAIINNIHPYDSYVDNSKKKEEFAAKRSYFFGPGYHQLKATVSDAWSGIGESVEWIFGVREKISDLTDTIVIHQVLWILSVIFVIFALVAIGLLGGAITCAFSIIHTTVLFAIMMVIYILFTITWVIDRIYLQIISVKANCPYDQVRTVIPMFQCPNCGAMHKRLVPGPYGVWHRHCTCGEKLPTTFLLGRSKLKAFCPKCGNELAASDVQQFAITVVGGTSSGKTVLLSSFFHEYFEYMERYKKAYYEIPEIHKDMFNNMEEWFDGKVCNATRMKDTSDMYSIILHSPDLPVNKQFSIYDIAGEAFDDPTLSSMLPQKQMRDSDGLVIVIDPLSALEMRKNAESEGDDTTNFSDAEASTVISNFVTYLKSVLTHGSIKNRSDKPVAVVITKADLSSVCREISYHKIKSIMTQNPGMFDTMESARDEVCKTFLNDIGLKDAVAAIEANFNEVHYFPVSAIGHSANGERYDPEHVLEPFCWLINKADPKLSEILGINKIV